ncbi:hypothetical protein [Roseovarius salinarum]|uniref:hypothetical protein n=1 Tax=Roseovarius salinarum TaxID=1981892 RepID=UPI000C346A80|nr:hypothetical protein [Roseovarius salinarum]
MARRLADFRPLTAAEQAVIAGLETGHVTVLGDGGLPGPEAGDDRRVRAGLIRWLALGAPGDGDVRLHEKGLWIAGALVVSDGQADPIMAGTTPGLDLQGCKLDHDLGLLGCRFRDPPVLRGTKLETLNLQGSHLPGLRADRLEARGNVFLRGVQATGEVRLLGARIGGNLDCDGGRFENAGGWALNADRLEARGNVFLRGVEATGEVRLPGGRISGDLACEGGRFENAGGRALNAAGARVTGAFFWRPDDNGNRADAKGALDLTAAEIGHINDDPACWPGPGDLVLDRCRYGAFTGHGINAGDRIRWLDLQDPAKFGQEFWPQPWEHCAQVLREMGHPEDAREVLIAKEERQRRVQREIAAARLTGARLRKRLESSETDHARQACANDLKAADEAFEHPGDPRRKAIRDEVMAASVLRNHEIEQLRADTGAIRARVVEKQGQLGTRGADATLAAQSAVTEAWSKLAPLRLRDGLLRALIAYGHKPLRALGWLAAFWLLGAVLFGAAYGDGGFKPNNAFILSKPEWAQCADGGARRGDHPSTLACYLAQPEAAGYPKFNAALYSLDTLVPVVELEVQDYWVPDAGAAAWARYYLWGHIAAGWFLVLLAVAGFSGLVQTRATEE